MRSGFARSVGPFGPLSLTGALLVVQRGAIPAEPVVDWQGVSLRVFRGTVPFLVWNCALTTKPLG